MRYTIFQNKGMERETKRHEYGEAAEMLFSRFMVRHDLHALQLPDGRYISIRQPVTSSQVVKHLKGELTLGTYLLDQESRAKFMVFDADQDDGLARLSGLAQSLIEKDVPVYLETSRRGGHLWFFFEDLFPAKEVRAFGRGIMHTYSLTDIELYPKQDELGDGPGSLIRLPFGVHRVSHKRYSFITHTGDLLAETIREQIRQLSDPLTVSRDAFSEFDKYQPVQQEKPPFRVFGGPTDASTEDIKARISVLAFVEQFIDLRPTATGAIGKCPFHEDQHASFGVNTKRNYWHCFAGCGGGSIIDFWMKWRNVEFPQAVDELKNLLGG